ncbi:MAG: Zn-dependent hydrolase [SAR324 cluster bacterium]|nr:Zn-dependent hydrolase [SAR324 cluster bacterium]
MTEPQVNGERLWQSLMEMAKIGATPRGGNCRLALTEEDRQGRELFRSWVRELGCAVSVDSMGNIFARRPGRDDSAAPVVTGSHLDTQPTGGKFDGVYGVLAGLEVLRALEDGKVETARPVEVVVWTNEEGSRFQPAMIGSGVFSGEMEQDHAYAQTDGDGVTLGQALEEIGYKGELPCAPRPVHAYLESHIEQGPVLEAEDKVVGVVTGIQGIKWFQAKVRGVNSHAGTTPMEVRRDPLVGASRMIDAIDRTTRGLRPDAVGTVGMFQVSPGSINVINEEVAFSLDLRCPDADALQELDRRVRAACGEVAEEMGLQFDLEEIWYSPPTAFEPSVVDAVEAAARGGGHSHRRIVSGAGHDAKYLADICPTGMIFIPCKDGISHNEIESAEPAHLAAGADVLLRTILELANQA